MGADAKRKEARKGIFGIQAATPLHVDGVSTVLRNPVVEQPAEKKMRYSPNPVSDSNENPPIQNQRVGNDLAIADLEVQADMARPAAQKKQRFIVFVGNLPYTATDESVQKHFARVHPCSIRHRSDKETAKSKGFAFLEFEGYDRMKTCLKLYHHLEFNDEVSPARKLNVELTAGGGGAKSTERRTRLRLKNERLSEQRKKRLQKQQALVKSKDELAGDVLSVEQRPMDIRDIHPSRRTQVVGS